MDARTIELIRTAPWEDIGNRLLWFTRRLMATKGLDELPGGHTDQDVAAMAIEAVVTGKRRWDPQKHPSLLTHLQWVVRSLLSPKGLLGRKERTAMTFTDCEDDLDVAAEETELLTPDDDAVRRAAAIEEAVSDDDDLTNMVLAIKLGAVKARDISRDTGLTPAQVYELRRKLARRAKKAVQRVTTTAGGQ